MRGRLEVGDFCVSTENSSTVYVVVEKPMQYTVVVAVVIGVTKYNSVLRKNSPPNTYTEDINLFERIELPELTSRLVKFLFEGVT